ncbi:hypothetical protein [Hufsiella ginkgonis]|uniref:Uncharacterized protein n=1 Tax=Hufsiella ginkgonis TaxID=2695274 RepID=A0A7K1XX31_9SPHI|nr:hypothetical protein [Hufsiella ginkgonis]MXV15269.1 hypothetical protein [Hufsiella ginkgonis]
MASKEQEADLLVWFCRNFLAHVNLGSSYKPLRTLFIRQLQKVVALAASLHEDLQHDLRQDIEFLAGLADERLKGFSRKDVKM